MPACPVGPADCTGVVIFFTCLDLKQKSSFMDGHELKSVLSLRTFFMVLYDGVVDYSWSY